MMGQEGMELNTTWSLILLCLMCRAYVFLKPDFSFPITFYLIPFTGIVGLIIIVMVVILVRGQTSYKVIQKQRERNEGGEKE